MMRLGVYSHCTIDTLRMGGEPERQIGGAACYCSITARQFKFEVELHTRFGADFPADYLESNHIVAAGALSDVPTTQFVIEVDGADREIRLKNACDMIPFTPSDADGILLSPLFGEVSEQSLRQIKDDAEFLFIDPQGFLRRSGPGGRIYLERTGLDLSGVSAIKASPEELRCLSGETGVDGMKTLQKMGTEHVLYTDGRDVSMLVSDRMYSIVLPNKKIHDTTGVGDIFCAAFACTILKEKDFLWALCFAGGAAQAALDSGKSGLHKVPRKGAVESNASYFYNTVKFRQV